MAILMDFDVAIAIFKNALAYFKVFGSTFFILKLDSFLTNQVDFELLLRFIVRDNNFDISIYANLGLTPQNIHQH